MSVSIKKTAGVARVTSPELQLQLSIFDKVNVKS